MVSGSHRMVEAGAVWLIQTDDFVYGVHYVQIWSGYPQQSSLTRVTGMSEDHFAAVRAFLIGNR